MHHNARFLCLAAALIVVMLPSASQAQATVQVQVRSAAGATPEGTVTLSAVGASRQYACQTSGGTCRIDGVVGGQYIVAFSPRQSPASPPRQVMIPPAGRVELIVAYGS